MKIWTFICFIFICADPEKFVSGVGVLTAFLYSSIYFKVSHTDLSREARGVSVLKFLRKPTATCDF